MSMPVLRYKMPLITKIISAIILMMPSTIRQELTPVEILRYIFLSAGGRLELSSETSKNTIHVLAKNRQADRLAHYAYVPRPLNCEHVYMP